MSGNYFYADKPVFGVDLGYSTAKIMQLAQKRKKDHAIVASYGLASFDPDAIKDGVIVDPVKVAKGINELFKSGLVGDVTTKRIAFSIPASRAFHRAVELPKLNEKDIRSAIELETEQYLPVSSAELYMDYEVTAQSKDKINVFVVAAPKKIVDSYVALAELLGCELAAIETTINSTARLFTKLPIENNQKPSILIDFGSRSSDITIINKGSIVVTGTVPYGGDHFTDSIAEKLGVSKAEAHTIKVRYGLAESKKRDDIVRALTPAIDQLNREIRKMVRYFNERSVDNETIVQVVTNGGGANMPGLHQYMSEKLGIPTRMLDIWQSVSYGKLQPPHELERIVYVTVAGLSLMQSREIFV